MIPVLSRTKCIYYMDKAKGILLRTKTLVILIRHYIRDLSGVFSVCHAHRYRRQSIIKFLKSLTFGASTVQYVSHAILPPNVVFTMECCSPRFDLTMGVTPFSKLQEGWLSSYCPGRCLEKEMFLGCFHLCVTLEPHIPFLLD